jgi:TolB-like protein
MRCCRNRYLSKSPHNGYVVWSEAYDGPLDNVLKLQYGIAGKVTIP